MQEPTTPLHSLFSGIKAHPQFFILYGLAVCLMCDWAEFYRTFQYLNVIVVIRYFYQGNRLDKGTLGLVLSIPIGFTILHMLAVGKIELIKEVRHLWLATFVTLGVCCLPGRDLSFFKRNYSQLTLALVYFFIVVQLLGSVLVENKYGFMQTGALSNPHYFGFYSSVALFMCIGLFFYARGFPRIMLGAAIVVLGTFVLMSSSRPAWVALFVSFLVWPLFMPVQKKVLYILLVPVLLFMGNVAGFSDRFVDLISNIGQEERVFIWSDSWKMQLASPWWLWLVGHGADSYLDDFVSYSHFHSLSRDFHSPHNSIMEVIYISGVVGLMLFMALHVALFRRLTALTRQGEHDRHWLVVTLVALIFIVAMIFLTMPILSPYNMYPLAYMAGICLLFGRNKNEAIDPGDIGENVAG